MDNRWAVYIDIEGFSALYHQGNDALWGLNNLMFAIYRIGENVFPESPNRLFVHQLGDGFLIVSEFHEESLDRAASIATVLMKFITSFGVFSRATIAEGGLADIKGCYSNEVMNGCDNNDWSTLRMGEGLMTIFPVMGTALINAVGIDKRSPKGPLLIMPSDYKSRLSDSFIKDVLDGELTSIDWIHTDLNGLSDISKKALLKYPSPENLEKLVQNYIAKHKLPSEWKESCSLFLAGQTGRYPFPS